MPTLKIFDATIQEEVDHEIEIGANGDVIATSEETGHFIKFPGNLTTKAQIEKAAAAHKKATQNQQVISPEEVAAQEKALENSQKLLDSLED